MRENYFTDSGDEVNSKCLAALELIGNKNSRPTATKLRERSVPGIGAEFQA